MPVPLSATVEVLPVVELLLMVNWSVSDPAVVGLNCTVTVTVWPGFRVAGRLPDATLNSAPAIEAEFTVTAVVPDDVSVTVLVVVEPTARLPKLRLATLTVS